jgi:hypothetical protein
MILITGCRLGAAAKKLTDDLRTCTIADHTGDGV